MKRPMRLLLIGYESYQGNQVIRGVDAYCREHGQWEFHIEGGSNSVQVKRAMVAIVKWKADGIIAYIRSDQLGRILRKSRLPVVNVDASREWNLPTVVPDSQAIGKMVARYFLDNGFRNFAFCPKVADLNNSQRCDAYVEELRKRGFGVEVFFDPSEYEPAVSWFQVSRRMERWVLSLKKPVAVMSTYDGRAQEIMLICRRLGLRIPDDVAVVAAGNSEVLCRMCTPPLSSVDPDVMRVGYEAAQLMDSLLRGGKPPAKPILIPPRGIVVRQSSDTIAVDDPDVAEAMRLIRVNAKQQFSVKDILQRIPICRKTLESRFEKLIGRTPHEEIVRVRMELARDLVHATAMPIKGIARTLGFGSPRHFSEFFRQHTKKTPMQYRQKIQTQGMPWSNAAAS